ncbi:unnamed protein product [Adineta ricciae]|uniref:Uncharacterized protein n=3 Tax=Adineta ricciae TaxID=249248 RepID=A0A814KH29_ADIRI|nr:unnamed protein product [Adineta ricciae]
MAAGNQDKIEDSIICCICHKVYDDPRILPCSHTYCRKCLEETALVNKDQFECPLHEGFTLPKNVIESLPVNRIIRHLIDINGSRQNPIECSNCHSAASEYRCDKCENETFCSKCYQTVHNPPVMQKHQQMSANETALKVNFCTSHRDEKVKYWCLTCSQLLCTDCILLEHKAHQYNLIPKMVQELELKITNNLNNVQMLVDEKLNKAIECINEYGNIADSYRKQIQNTMSCLRQAIDEHEQDLLNQILTVENEQKNQMEEYRLRWKYEPENVQMHKAMLDILLLTKNYAILLNGAQEFEDYVTRTNDVLKKTSIPVASEYELIELDQLEAIKKYIFHCGRYVKTNNSLLVRSALKQHSTQEHSSDSTVPDIHLGLVVLTSNEYPNDMYLPKQQRQKRLCRK